MHGDVGMLRMHTQLCPVCQLQYTAPQVPNIHPLVVFGCLVALASCVLFYLLLSAAYRSCPGCCAVRRPTPWMLTTRRWWW